LTDWYTKSNWPPFELRQSVLGIASLAAFLGLSQLQTSGSECSSPPLQIKGVAATGFAPLLQLWAKNYQERTGTACVIVALGNRLALRQLQQRAVQFAALDDVFVSQHTAELAEFVRVTVVSENLAIVYSLPGVSELRLSRSALVGLFTGTITNWNNLETTAANPGALHTPTPVRLVIGVGQQSGPACLARWLQKVDSLAANIVGQGENVHWPGEIIAQGGEGLSGFIKANPGSIAIAEYAYALANDLSCALIESAPGEYRSPGGGEIERSSSNSRYPLKLECQLVYRLGADSAAVVGFLEFCVTVGQDQALQLGFNRLGK